MGYLYFFTILVEGHFTKLVYMSLTSFGLTPRLHCAPGTPITPSPLPPFGYESSSRSIKGGVGIVTQSPRHDYPPCLELHAASPFGRWQHRTLPGVAYLLAATDIPGILATSLTAAAARHASVLFSSTGTEKDICCSSTRCVINE